MQPNLKAHSAKSIEFTATVSLSQDAVSRVAAIGKPDADGDYLFLTSYDYHRGFLWLIGNKKIKSTYSLRFTFERFNRKIVKIDRGFPSIDKLIDILGPAKINAEWYCQIGFVFTRDLKPRGIINLPWKYIDSPNVPFDKILGLHLSKTEGKKNKYEIILDTPYQGAISETIFWDNYKSEINDSLADIILKEAVNISDQIVLKG